MAGWVNNSPVGVFIEVEGSRENLDCFLTRIDHEKPPRSSIQSLEPSYHDAAGFVGFEIRQSESGGEKTALVLPDIATCADCLNDLFDPGNRRYQYPFTNCTNCGPRYSIIESLPYDRARTTMKQFVMCEACCAEYENPLDRRFHAQPNACPVCGPQLEYWDGSGSVISKKHDALLAAADAIGRGRIVAVKGIGGFHLMADARSDSAIQTLRQRKRREEKPFAVMLPSITVARAECEVTDLECRLLDSPESPIVLLKRRLTTTCIHSAVAPRNPYLGVMLPYAPLHHQLMAVLRFPVVATSGNLADEPICTDEMDALSRLSGIADAFLVHNRPIARHVDDSIIRVVAGREMMMRRARGYAPLPRPLDHPQPVILAVGAHLKNTIAVSIGRDAFISQHIGDLETTQSFDAFQRVIASFGKLYDVQPAEVACDRHPDYLSTQYSEGLGLPMTKVQHHFAHVLSCMADNEITGGCLGVSWDGTGFGLDGTIWGGEFLRVGSASITDHENRDEADEDRSGGAGERMSSGAGCSRYSFTRVAHIRTFPLPGGDRAIKEPRRSAAGLLFELFGEALFENERLPVFSADEETLLCSTLTRRVNCPRTSSAGRLFDAVAALTGLCPTVRFEGQAAMELEFLLETVASNEQYTIDLVDAGPEMNMLVLDWASMVKEILQDIHSTTPIPVISAKFHNALADAIVSVAMRVAETRVVLSGGCFQNRYLTERAIQRLRQEGFHPYWHQRVPPNDGGLSLGQIMAAGR